jgi:hypothetical protein
MTLTEMIADVRERVGERTPNFWTDEFITARLNEGQTRFAREEKWQWLQTVDDAGQLTAGDNTLDLQTNVDFNRHFAIALYTVADPSTPIVPKRVRPTEALRFRDRYTTDAEPLYWYLVQTNAGAAEVRFVPSADQTYDVEYFYFRDPAPLVNGADESDIPPAYQEAVLSWATAQCWLKELTAERKAQAEFNIYNSVLEQARTDQQSLAIGESIRWGGDEYKLTRQNLLHRMLFAGGPLGG